MITKSRNDFAGMERDDSSGTVNGIDHTWWRKYDSESGRWTSPNPYKGSMRVGDPQSFNRYAYVGNDPVNFIDPSGLKFVETCSTVYETAGGGKTCVLHWAEDPEEMDFGHGEGDLGGGFPHVGGHVRTHTPQERGPGQPPRNCGVNPITGQPGFSTTPTGEPGNLRTGVGGGGDFGDRRRRADGSTYRHTGVDIRGYKDLSLIYANRAGTVIESRYSASAGNLITIDHGGGVTTTYMHNFFNEVNVGDKISEAQVIGAVGQTGSSASKNIVSEAHVHFEVRVNGIPTDPKVYLNNACPK